MKSSDSNTTCEVPSQYGVLALTYVGTWPRSPVAILTPIVTAGFICVLLPTARATTTPEITAIPQPVVMTSHPESLPKEPFYRTHALTPDPIRIKVNVPSNSPRNALDIDVSG